MTGAAHPVPGHVVILGGGTAGWMAACLVAHRWGPRGTRVTLVESAEIGIIGVGEGSTPQLKALFDTLGIAEAEWMGRANATYKTGIRFDGWSDRPGFERYFHPFPAEVDFKTAPHFFHRAFLRRNGIDVAAHPDDFFLPTLLAERRLAPLPAGNFPFEASYGYHFDAHAVGAVLRDAALARGVTRIEATVEGVELAADGRVAALRLPGDRRVAGDWFIDASGFRAAIAEGALGGRRLSFADNLFNDRAVVLPTALDAEGPGVATRATALSAGWAWHIPLTSRVGNGYVYSSSHIDDAAAEAELRAHSGAGDGVEARLLKMRVGRIEDSWQANCLAIGLAQGFLEPLEATALHLVIATLEGFLDALDAGGDTPETRARFNAAIAWRYEGIRDYIVCHYRAAQRRDTDYWRDATGHDHLSDSLKAIFTCWFTGGNLVEEIAAQGIEGCYNATSWHCLLAGYGNFPPPGRLAPPPPSVHVPDLAADRAFVAACAENFPSHLHALGALQGAPQPLGKIA